MTSADLTTLVSRFLSITRSSVYADGQSLTNTYLNAGMTDLRKSMLEAEANAEIATKLQQTNTGTMKKEQEENANSLVN
tara:strand:- start:191 stop:427 length:237 start_codon:yes stop_codon:yes gene_type:complete